jgi:hypothetical protein
MTCILSRHRVLASAALVISVTAACGDDATSPVVTSPVTTSPVTTSPVTTSPVTTSPVVGSGAGISEQEIDELERQLDEIDALLSGIENDLAGD